VLEPPASAATRAAAPVERFVWSVRDTMMSPKDRQPSRPSKPRVRAGGPFLLVASSPRAGSAAPLSARISANAGVARSGLQNRGLQVRFLPGLFQ